MHYQDMADSIPMPCAVMSVQQTRDGACGDIRIVCANRAYKEILGPGYQDGVLYQEVVRRNASLEHFCYLAAIEGKWGRFYVEASSPGIWTDEAVIPLRSTEEGVGRCLVVLELTNGREMKRRASVSMDTAEAAIRASITLMEAKDFREGVRTVLSDTLAMSGAHNSRLFLLDRKNRSLHVFCESIGPEGYGRHNDAVTYDLVELWEKSVKNSSSLLITNERDLEALEEENPAWVSNMRRYQVHTLVLIPLRRGREIFGYVDFVNFDVTKVRKVRELVELIAIYLGTELANYLLLERLEEMSTTDALTGLKNRNAMHRRMAMMGDECFGVINLDLNGLKVVNDRDGHEAGDRMLVSAAEALKKIFYNNDIYRTGGDEFIVMAPGITRESFERKLDRFQNSVRKDGTVSFSMGAVWSDGTTDLSSAFRLADERMYADKKRYYEMHPERRRNG